MSAFKTWSYGVIIIIVFAILSEAVLYFHDYVYHKLDIKRNTLILLLWTLPLVASFYVVYRSKKHRTFLGLSYIIVTTFTVLIAHYLNGKIGGKVDLADIAGLRILAPMVFFMSFIACGIGVVLGTGAKHLKKHS